MSETRPKVELIGVPFNSAGKRDGVARAPAALRAGLVDALFDADVDAVDRADLELPMSTPERDTRSRVIAPEALAAMISAVDQTVGEAFDRGTFPLVIGGDCPVLLGCLSATSMRGGARVLFVDGHEDAWPPPQSTTGEAADMELGWLLGRGRERLPAALDEVIPTLAPDEVIVLGARDADELAEAGVASIGDEVLIVRPDAIAAAPRGVATDATSRLGDRGPWWLHVDLDVLSTDSLDAVDYLQPGGLDWTTLTELTQAALASPRALGWSVTIYNPDLDPGGVGARRIIRYVADVLCRPRVP